VDFPNRSDSAQFATVRARFGFPIRKFDGIISFMTASFTDQIVEPFVEFLNEDSARKIVELRASAEVQSKFDELAEKANKGELSSLDRGKYDRLLAAFHFVTVMQSKARRRLAVGRE
jgi:hypothetical protein